MENASRPATGDGTSGPVIERSRSDLTDELLGAVRKLALDLHPKGDRIRHLGLGDDLDEAFGFDSIGRAKLVLRLERLFDVHLPDELRASAQTPNDLLNALVRAEARVTECRPMTKTVIDTGTVEPVPDRTETLTDVLAWHVERHPDRPHILLSNGDEEEPPITYAMLAKEAGAVARGLREWGLEPGETVAIMLPTGREYEPAQLPGAAGEMILDHSP